MDFEPAVQEYLKEGIRRGVHNTPTAKSLRRWFSIPVPKSPPDFFITYLFRGSPRFIYNSARAYNLTNILGGRLLSNLRNGTDPQSLASALNRQSERWMEHSPGREYRGGLKKIEPRELSGLEIEQCLVQLMDRPVAKKESPPSLFE